MNLLPEFDVVLEAVVLLDAVHLGLLLKYVSCLTGRNGCFLNVPTCMPCHIDRRSHEDFHCGEFVIRHLCSMHKKSEI